MRVFGVAAAASAAVFMLATPTLAQQKFDGNWSVEVLTEKGECDKAYRFPVIVQNSRARYGGSESFNVSGTIAGNGAINSSISYGGASANITGRLAGDSGTGTWTTSGSKVCSGRWNAEKRS